MAVIAGAAALDYSLKSPNGRPCASSRGTTFMGGLSHRD